MQLLFRGRSLVIFSEISSFLHVEMEEKPLPALLSGNGTSLVKTGKIAHVTWIQLYLHFCRIKARVWGTGNQTVYV